MNDFSLHGSPTVWNLKLSLSGAFTLPTCEGTQAPEVFLGLSSCQPLPGSVFDHSSPRSSPCVFPHLPAWVGGLPGGPALFGETYVVVSDQSRLLHGGRDSLLLFVFSH